MVLEGIHLLPSIIQLSTFFFLFFVFGSLTWPILLSTLQLPSTGYRLLSESNISVQRIGFHDYRYETFRESSVGDQKYKDVASCGFRKGHENNVPCICTHAEVRRKYKERFLAWFGQRCLFCILFPLNDYFSHVLTVFSRFLHGS